MESKNSSRSDFLVVTQRCLKRRSFDSLVASLSQGNDVGNSSTQRGERLVWHFANCALRTADPISYCSTNQPTTWISTVKKSRMLLSTTTAPFVSFRMIRVSSSTGRILEIKKSGGTFVFRRLRLLSREKQREKKELAALREGEVPLALKPMTKLSQLPCL